MRGALWRRLAWPERGRLSGFALSLALGVAALAGVSGVLRAVEVSLYAQARDGLGGDIKLQSWRALEGDEWVEATRARLAAEGELTEVVELASMAALEGQPPALVSLKGVSGGYPLRGSLTLREPVGEVGAAALGEGEVWIASSLADQRGARVGHRISIGGRFFKIAGVIAREPDAGFIGALAFAPRVMMRLDDLTTLELIKRGSRARRALVWAGTPTPEVDPAERARALRAELAGSAPEHIEAQSYVEAQPSALRVFERVGVFFSMISLVTLSLAALSFTAGLLGLLRDHLPLIGALKSLGVPHRALSQLYTRICLGIGLIGGLAGALIGVGLSALLATLAAPWLGLSAPPSIALTPSALLAPIGLCVWVSLCVNAAAQRALARAATQSLWRAPDPELRLTYAERVALGGALAATLWAYLTFISKSAPLATAFTLSLAALIGACALLIWLGMAGLRGLERWLRRGGARGRGEARGALSASFGLRFALRSLLGHRGRAAAALLSLSVGFSLIAGLQITERHLNAALSLSDADAPQVFLIDIQDDQMELTREAARASGVAGLEDAPLVRARLTGLNGAALTAEALSDESAVSRARKSALVREHSLTTRQELGPAERVVLGRWWTAEEAADPNAALISLEERYAAQLSVGVGDTLTFDIQGVALTFTITSLRSVDWLSLRPNFLFITPPAALEGAPRTHLASARLPSDQTLSALSTALMRAAPNISLVDLRPIFAEGRRLLTALNIALQLTGGLCALVGALLLISSARRDYGRRARAVHTLSLLGVPARRGWRLARLEFVIIGALSALTVTLCASALAALAARALDLPPASSALPLTLWGIMCLTAPVLAGLGRPARALSPRGEPT